MGFVLGMVKFPSVLIISFALAILFTLGSSSLVLVLAFCLTKTRLTFSASGVDHILRIPQESHDYIVMVDLYFEYIRVCGDELL